VFQPFQVPNLRSSSYRYCGLRNQEGYIDNDALWRRLHESIDDIHQTKRTETWLSLVGIEDVFGREVDRSFLEAVGPELDARLRILSTGQIIVLALFTDLLANVEEQSLFLCDEPESYLHPTLLSTFLRLMHSVLDTYDSYAIIATHSPIVVQEVPSRNIRVFEREGMIPIQAEIGSESFGENLTELVDRVFRVNEDDKNYKTILRTLADNYSDEEIEGMFEAGLSLNARLYLKSLRSPVG
jgi:predicted ATP-dependent endonuclease of OLD family